MIADVPIPCIFPRPVQLGLAPILAFLSGTGNLNPRLYTILCAICLGEFALVPSRRPDGRFGSAPSKEFTRAKPWDIVHAAGLLQFTPIDRLKLIGANRWVNGCPSDVPSQLTPRRYEP